MTLFNSTKENMLWTVCDVKLYKRIINRFINMSYINNYKLFPVLKKIILFIPMVIVFIFIIFWSIKSILGNNSKFSIKQIKNEIDKNIKDIKEEDKKTKEEMEELIAEEKNTIKRINENEKIASDISSRITNSSINNNCEELLRIHRELNKQ